MSNTNKQLAAIARWIMRIVPILVGLALLALVVAWISGIFEEKIPPGEAIPVARTLGGQPNRYRARSRQILCRGVGRNIEGPPVAV